jgi:crotonobetainyl-CoA:carnitine CoA-transferase CaiB-like acyl-CoA transferase
MASALSDVRVLDLSRVLAGPWATQILADLGADVIKVERRGLGDDTRAWGPPYLTNQEGRPTSESAYFLTANRNKRSLAVDIATPAGQEIVKRLACQSDVLVENFKAGGLAQYGLDYESLREHNPRLIYCSITGFGQTGPYADRPGYDFAIQAIGGLMSITGVPDGQPGAGPQKVGVALTDVMTGIYASTAILAALHRRATSGVGQYIDISLLDVQLAALANQASNFLTTGVSPVRLGNAHPNIVPYQDFETSDGRLVVAVGNDTQFRSLCRVLLREELADDERFSSNRGRVNTRATLIPMLQEDIRRWRTSELLGALEANGVPCSPVNNIGQAFSDPHVIARNTVIEQPHPLGGVVRTVANPIRMSEAPPEYNAPPPLLGQHTREVLSGVLGMSDEKIDLLLNQQVIGVQE